MDTIIVQPATKSEQQLLTSLLKKMGIKVKVVSEEQKEDIGLAMLIKEADRTQKVSRKTIMEKLQK